MRYYLPGGYKWGNTRSKKNNKGNWFCAEALVHHRDVKVAKMFMLIFLAAHKRYSKSWLKKQVKRNLDKRDE